MSIPEIDDYAMISVCSACRRASCLAGTYLCERSRSAGVEWRFLWELRRLALEHSSYWKLATPAAREGGPDVLP